MIHAPGRFPRLAIVPAPRLKVGAHATSQVLRLADVDDPPRLVLVQIDAGREGQIPEFLFEGQKRAPLSDKRKLLP